MELIRNMEIILLQLLITINLLLIPRCGDVALYSDSEPWQSNNAISLAAGSTTEILVVKMCYEYEI